MAKRNNSKSDPKNITKELIDLRDETWGAPEPRRKRARRTSRSVSANGAIDGNGGTDDSSDSENTNGHARNINDGESANAKVRS